MLIEFWSEFRGPVERSMELVLKPEHLIIYKKLRIYQLVIHHDSIWQDRYTVFFKLVFLGYLEVLMVFF
jgi:hypothetical protein